MRKFLIALGASVVLGTAFAVAGDPPPAEAAAEATESTEAAPADASGATEVEEETPNCAELPEGDERTACEEKVKEMVKAKAAADAAEAAGPDGAKGAKSGKAARSNTNRMESEFTDE